MKHKKNISKHVALLREFYARERRLPGYIEMMDLFGYTSKHSVFYIVRELERQAYVTKDFNGKLSPTEKLSASIRILGSIQSGIPLEAEDIEVAPVVAADRFLSQHPENSFLLSVVDDSMIEAGIGKGDHVLVESTDKANIGDIVLAKVDSSEWMLRVLAKDMDGYFLRPANKQFDPVRSTTSLKIGGVLCARIRHCKK